jgi:hypothetical protein
LTPYATEYAPKAARFRNIISRLRLVPLFLEQAKSNLLRVPAAWCKAAMEENQGKVDFVDGELRNAAPADVRQEYDQAADVALPARRKFQDLLTNKLQYLDDYSWRLGPELYNRKFRLGVGVCRLGAGQARVSGKATGLDPRAHVRSGAAALPQNAIGAAGWGEP